MNLRNSLLLASLSAVFLVACPAEDDGTTDSGSNLVDDADGDGWLVEDGDCDDTDDTIYPEAEDTWYDGVDSDCAGDSDYDADGDGFDSADYDGDDCDDADAAINTAAEETWYDDVDSDCDGESDFDADGDGHDSDAFEDGDDCDDDDSSIHPSAVDTWYDGVDSDCAEDNDYDADADGHDSADHGGDDCDDDNEGANPSQLEVCDDLDTDEDCSGAADNDDAGTTDFTTWYVDLDGDGYGDSSDAGTGYCDVPTGVVDNNSDCDDDDIGFNPDAVEDDCTDPNDYNCDGSVSFDDADGDGWAACEECNDSDGAINPDAVEVCDSVDNDCNGDVDDDDAGVDTSTGSLWYADSDGDTYGDEDDAGVMACSQAAGTVASNDDCDDDDSSVYPGASEVPQDGVDQDCDGSDANYGVDDLIAGDLVITEIMKNPNAVGDEFGEWIEIYNASGLLVDLDGLNLSDDGSDSDSLAGELLVDAGDYVVLGVNDDTATNGGVAVDATYSYSVYKLGNGTDEVILSSSTTVLDTVDYNDNDFPDSTGVSASLDPDSSDATSNDDGPSWCDSTSEITSGGDLGTPGSANDDCPEATYSYADDIHDLWESNSSNTCTGCHPTSGGLDLSGGASATYTILMGSANHGDTLVVPGDSAGSRLYQKLAGSAGTQMPKGASALTSAELDLIAEWIDAGANP